MRSVAARCTSGLAGRATDRHCRRSTGSPNKHTGLTATSPLPSVCSDRLLRPLRRVGQRGDGEFEPVSWDAALSEIAHRLSTTRDKWGARGGPRLSQLRRVRSGQPVPGWLLVPVWRLHHHLRRSLLPGRGRGNPPHLRASDPQCSLGPGQGGTDHPLGEKPG
ncbi:MAG: molybdopterin-dependent oxidoreductase [Bacillota bacterium]